MNDETFQVLVKTATDWQYLTILAGRMARKSDGEKYLMSKFNVNHSDAHEIFNCVESGPGHFITHNGYVDWIAQRPAPTFEQYPDIDTGKYRAPAPDMLHPDAATMARWDEWERKARENFKAVK